MAKVKVKCVAEQLTYSGFDGVASNYVVGDVFEMEEDHALNALGSHRPCIVLADAESAPAPSRPAPRLDAAQVKLDEENAAGRARAEAAAKREAEAEAMRSGRAKA